VYQYVEESTEAGQEFYSRTAWQAIVVRRPFWCEAHIQAAGLIEPETHKVRVLLDGGGSSSTHAALTLYSRLRTARRPSILLPTMRLYYTCSIVQVRAMRYTIHYSQDRGGRSTGSVNWARVQSTTHRTLLAGWSHRWSWAFVGGLGACSCCRVAHVARCCSHHQHRVRQRRDRDQPCAGASWVLP